MVAGTETIYTVQLKNRHVRKIDFEFTDEFVHCPECDEEVATLGEIEFGSGYEYECPDCGKKLTEEEMIDAIRDQISEYDV